MVVGDETNHCCVVRKLNNVVAVIGLKDGAQSWVSSLKGTEHRALGGPIYFLLWRSLGNDKGR